MKMRVFPARKGVLITCPTKIRIDSDTLKSDLVGEYRKLDNWYLTVTWEEMKQKY